MILVSKLNLKSQWVYRIESPKGQYFIDFKLDPESEYHLIEEATKLNSRAELRNFEQGIEEAAIIAALKVPESEIESRNIAEYLRLQIDPKYTGTTFAFQIKPGGAKNTLVITKGQIIGGQIQSDNSACTSNPLQATELNLPPQFVSTNVWVKPVSIDYLLDDATKAHLEDYASTFYNKNQIEDIEKTIRKAVRIATHRMVENGLICRPSGSKIKWGFKDEENQREFKFLFTIINGRRFLVNKIRVRDIFR